MSDGTQVNAGVGDLIADEDMPVGQPRGVPGLGTLQTTGYKNPRSKITIGEFGADQGDVGDRNPLPVRMHLERRLFEIQSMRDLDRARDSLRTRAWERSGAILSDRGMR